MKSLVFTAQDARELEATGKITIQKPIKNVPQYVEGARLAMYGVASWLLIGPDGDRLGAERDGAIFTPPVQFGDAVLIREPWHRLQAPDGKETERVILAADSTVGEGQTSYKWSSPVSMPEEAARRFARVISADAIYTADAAIWKIELERISRQEAAAMDGGAPLSTAKSPEEGSDCYTYTGDMSQEEHEHMVKEIEADRDRLEAVQDRLIGIAARRKELAYLLFEGRGEVDHNDLDGLEKENDDLDSEEAALAFEEGELRASLEDAGVHTLTTIERAKERLAEIEAIQDTDQGLEKERTDLTSYLADAAEAKGDAAGPADDTRDEEQGEEDEETGSFTLGKCKYCGREWGVTLEGSKSGGYPTQRTADAAATRVCDCAEAVANRAPEVGVAFAVTVGTCSYCGQIQEVGPHPSQAAADETASEVCNCPRARMERRVHEQIADACERVQRLFGDGAEDLGFKPIHDEAVGLLEKVVELIARGPISSASINVRGQGKAKFSVTSKGKIKVSRSETRSCDLEAGE